VGCGPSTVDYFVSASRRIVSRRTEGSVLYFAYEKSQFPNPNIQ
jgi:hypothetical protein